MTCPVLPYRRTLNGKAMTTMTAARVNRWLCVLLIAYIAGSCAVQLENSTGGLVRWSGFSVLVPVTAAALLPMRRSLLIGAATLAATVVTYGFAIHGVSAGGRTVVITAVALSFALSIVVSRVRSHRLNAPATATRNRSCPPDPADSDPCNTPEAPHPVAVSPPASCPPRCRNPRWWSWPATAEPGPAGSVSAPSGSTPSRCPAPGSDSSPAR